MFFQVVVIVKQLPSYLWKLWRCYKLILWGKEKRRQKFFFPGWTRDRLRRFLERKIQWFTFFCLAWTCNYLKAKWKPEFVIPDLKAISKSFYNRPNCGSTAIYLTFVFCFLSTHRLQKLELNEFPENRRFQSIMTLFFLPNFYIEKKHKK